jgi:hypothetical protein
MASAVRRSTTTTAASRTLAPEIGRFAAGLGGFRRTLAPSARQPAKLAGCNPQSPAVEVAPFAVDEVDKIAVELRTAAEGGNDRRRRRDHGGVACARAQGRRQGGRCRARGANVRGLGQASRTARPRGRHLDLHNWRCRDWYPALEAAGVAKRGPYALRHTYATWALRAELGTFELGRCMGTSVGMIDRTYGHLAAGSQERARRLLGTYAAEAKAEEDGASL